jgi:hypothetical protein
MSIRLLGCGLVAACAAALAASGHAAPPATGGDTHQCLYGGTWAAHVVGNPLKGLAIERACAREGMYIALEGTDGRTYVFFAGVASGGVTVGYDAIRASGLKATRYSSVTFQALGLDDACLPNGRPSTWVMFIVGTDGTLTRFTCLVPPV